MVKRIEKITREAISSKKYKAGTREVMKSIRGSKLIIISESMEQKPKEKLENQAPPRIFHCIISMVAHCSLLGYAEYLTRYPPFL